MWYFVRAKNMEQYLCMLEAAGFHAYEVDDDLTVEMDEDDRAEDFDYIATLVQPGIVPYGMCATNDTSEGKVVSLEEFISLYDDREKIIDGVKVIFQQNGDVMINGKTFCKEGVEEFIAEYTRKI